MSTDRLPTLQRIIPTEGHSRLRQNHPDSPTAETQLLNEISIALVSPRQPAPNNCQTEIVHVLTYKGRGEQIFARGLKITPTSRSPILERKTIPHGGGRIIGGGTSREAIRAAKRQAKRSPR
ncbi:MAG: hypothetical protein Q8P25_00385 [Candidatus Curtissbacteria bacterium]|nr:hypothetical protein [Candidatus Curtissbacteria bacterium]